MMNRLRERAAGRSDRGVGTSTLRVAVVVAAVVLGAVGLA